MLTIDVALLLAVILVLLVRRRVQARSRVDQMLCLTVAVTLGVLLAPTAFGRAVIDFVAQLAQGLSGVGQ
ncbi:hypothetical protein GCM10010358_49010 [Streptomyces minutiscleroticus]|uniref:Uncharacterized protein n=2 Tax=Streptomyces minutiscleroticus TaxID=68238 RepID=A0A918NRB4_9ACTN|nr:hypothetical protein GCM10010358_49010 [Streptomyces minutiscleroticus]